MTQVNAPAPVTRVLRTVKTMGQGAQAPLLLELDLTAGLLPATPTDLAGRLQARGTPTLPGVVRALKEAAQDRHVHGLVAKLGEGGCGWRTRRSSRAPSGPSVRRASGRGRGRRASGSWGPGRRATCWRAPSTRSGCSPPATSG